MEENPSAEYSFPKYSVRVVINSASRCRTMPALFDIVSSLFNGGIVLRGIIFVNAGIVIK